MDHYRVINSPLKKLFMSTYSARLLDGRVDFEPDVSGDISQTVMKEACYLVRSSLSIHATIRLGNYVSKLFTKKHEENRFQEPSVRTRIKTLIQEAVNRRELERKMENV